jgi:predicted  nucleic acid-binding Zn-ribbon protein
MVRSFNGTTIHDTCSATQAQEIESLRRQIKFHEDQLRQQEESLEQCFEELEEVSKLAEEAGRPVDHEGCAAAVSLFMTWNEKLEETLDLCRATAEATDTDTETDSEGESDSKDDDIIVHGECFMKLDTLQLRNEKLLNRLSTCQNALAEAEKQNEKAPTCDQGTEADLKQACWDCEKIQRKVSDAREQIQRGDKSLSPIIKVWEVEAEQTCGECAALEEHCGKLSSASTMWQNLYKECKDELETARSRKPTQDDGTQTEPPETNDADTSTDDLESLQSSLEEASRSLLDIQSSLEQMDDGTEAVQNQVGENPDKSGLLTQELRRRLSVSQETMAKTFALAKAAWQRQTAGLRRASDDSNKGSKDPSSGPSDATSRVRRLAQKIESRIGSVERGLSKSQKVNGALAANSAAANLGLVKLQIELWELYSRLDECYEKLRGRQCETDLPPAKGNRPEECDALDRHWVWNRESEQFKTLSAVMKIPDILATTEHTHWFRWEDLRKVESKIKEWEGMVQEIKPPE